MLNHRLWLLFVLAVRFFAAPVWSATVYVETASNGGSDANSGTQGSPVATIQKGIDLASAGDTVHVGTGAWTERVTINKNNISLIGSGASTSTIVGTRFNVVSGCCVGSPPASFLTDNGQNGAASVIHITSDTTGAVVRGFTIASDFHGIFTEPRSTALIEYNQIEGAALNNITVDGSSPTIRRNLIIGRSPHFPSYHSSSGVDVWTPSQPVVENNTMADFSNLGVCTLKSATPIYRNNIIVNAPKGIATPDNTASGVTVEYNNVWNNTLNFDSVTKWRTGWQGNISADPVFVSTAIGHPQRYRLRSCSPSIDSGKPDSGYNDPDGTRNDMGAFYTPGGRSALLPPSQMTAERLAGAKIKLTWTISPSTTITTGYKLYYTSGSHLEYTTPDASLTASTTYWISGALLPGSTYQFGLRATDGLCEDGNTSVTASIMPVATLPAPPSARCEIKTPKAGKKVAGNRVLIMCDPDGNTNKDGISQVRFEYLRADGLSFWTTIPAANANHPNPDSIFPFFTHWDVSTLEKGPYFLRAITTAGAAVDNDPPTILIEVTGTGSGETADIKTSDVAGGREHEEVIHNAVSNLVTVGEKERDSEVQVLLPAGVLNNSSDTVKVTITVNNPTGVSPAASESTAGVFLDVSLINSGQKNLNGSAVLTISYPDTDQNGVVDGGGGITEDQLKMKYFNTTINDWVLVEGAQSVDTSANTVRAETTHFTVFGLFFGVSATTLDGARVYPSPFIPDDGDADNGRPFSAGDANSGIVFDQITDDASIRVYDVTGRIVWSYDSPATQGRVQWDVRNRDGKDVASGVYFAVIKGGGQTITKKIAIIR